MSARAGIVVTGTEVLTGRISDRNGPWLADRLLELGIELAHITITGDRAADMEAQLRFMADQDVDVIITSGGLGPTADDMTVEVVARFAGLPLGLDEALEERIANILRGLMQRFRHWDFDAVRAANRKQAVVPEGAYVIDPVGTAPGVVVPGKPTVVVLPGPPRELQGMWEEAVSTEAFQEATAGRTIYEQDTIRLFGLPESGIAETLRVAEAEIAGFERLEITTCLRRGEVEVVTRHEPGETAAYDTLVELIRARHPRELFSEDGSRVDDQVAALLAGRRAATAESCTAGLMAARLTERPGSSAYVAGGVVAYANEAKVALLDVDRGAHRAPWRGVSRGGGGDGGGGAPPLRRGHRGGDHRDRGTGRRDRGEAGGHGVLPRGHVRRPLDRARPAAPRGARRRPRALDHGGHAPAAAAPPRRGGGDSLSGPRARMFVALDLPAPARQELAQWRDELVEGRTDLRPVPADKLHVTLAFLGWQDEAAAERIAATAFGAAGGPAPLLVPGEVRAVPPRDPRLFALDLEDRGGHAASASGRGGGGARVGSGLQARAPAPSGRTSRSHG